MPTGRDAAVESDGRGGHLLVLPKLTLALNPNRNQNLDTPGWPDLEMKLTAKHNPSPNA